MVRLLANATAITAALVLFVLIARWIGGLDRAPVAFSMLETGACAQPCWHGIQPGKTSIDQVAELTRGPGKATTDSMSLLYSNEFCWDRSVSNWHGCVRRDWASNPGTPIESIQLVPPDGALRLGDVMMWLGEPVASDLCWLSQSVAAAKSIAIVYFGKNIVVFASAPTQAANVRLNPALIVSLIAYYEPSISTYNEQMPVWRGFISQTAVHFC